VQIQIKDPFLRTISRQQKLKAPTNVTKEIYDAAVAIAEKSWSMSAPVRLLSVTGTGLTDRCTEQMTLIGDTTEEKLKGAKLDRAMDGIRSRFGKDAISYGRLIQKPKDLRPGRTRRSLAGQARKRILVPVPEIPGVTEQKPPAAGPVCFFELTL
jgi:DNA polymerase-4